MADELDIRDVRTLELQAAIMAAASAEHRITFLTAHGRRVVMIAPANSDPVKGYSPLEAAIAELARLQEPYQRQLARVRELIAQENASLRG